MKKVTGMFFAASVLCFWVMASLVIAAPPGLEDTVPVSYPDLRMTQMKIKNTTAPEAPPSIGDKMEILCTFYLCGCVEQMTIWARVDIDGTLFWETSSEGVPPLNYMPTCGSNQSFYSCRGKAFSPIWTATPGSHTIKCIVDSKNEIAEGSELNNTMSIKVNVPLPKPAIDKIKDIKTKQPIPVPVPGTR